MWGGWGPCKHDLLLLSLPSALRVCKYIRGKEGWEGSGGMASGWEWDVTDGGVAIRTAPDGWPTSNCLLNRFYQY